MTKFISKTQFMIIAFAVAVLTTAGLNNPAAAQGDALKLAWSADIGDGKTLLTPTVVDGKVLSATATGPLVALDAVTGEPQWRYAPADKIWSRGVRADGDQVFVCLKSGKMAALNLSDGTEQWRVDLGINCVYPPHVSGDTIFVSTTFVGTGLPSKPLTGAKIFSIERAGGKINWSFTTDSFLLQTPTTYGDTVYIGGSYIDPNFKGDEGGASRFQALERDTGRLKWTHESPDGRPKTVYATQNELVYIAYQDYAYGLDANTGERMWKRNTSNWVPALTGRGNTVYYGAANTDVYAISTPDGKVRWKYNIPGGTFNYVLRSPFISGDKLYFITQKGHIYALDLNKGEPLWMHETGETIRIGVSVNDGYVYTGSINGQVLAYKIMK